MVARPPTLRPRLLDRDPGGAERANDLVAVLEGMAHAGKALGRTIRRAALAGGLGLAGGTNPTGEAQKKLDVVANEIVLEAMAATGRVARVVSEELGEARTLSAGSHARYLLCIDPLDGSSNTDTNGSLGTIFGLYRHPSASQGASGRELLHRGLDQVATGYILYGPSTLLVCATGAGVDGFTLDEDLGEFVLTHPDLRCPSRGRTFSANLGHCQSWSPGIRAFASYLAETDAASGRPYRHRYSGALVADVHSILVDGGVYFYPADGLHPNGKLRLVYECAPLACVVERAGGKASTGLGPILAIEPESIHQRVPLAVGSADDVGLFERFVERGIREGKQP